MNILKKIKNCKERKGQKFDDGWMMFFKRNVFYF